MSSLSYALWSFIILSWIFVYFLKRSERGEKKD